MQTSGKEGKEVIVVEMDCWASKEIVMKSKSKLGSRKIFIDHDLSFEEREVQRLIRDRARKEKMDGKRVKIGYKKLEIQGRKYVWNEEENTLIEKKNF